jgi:hypothetical protein
MIVNSHLGPLYLLASTGRIIALMMEVASTSETPAKFYQTTRRNNPEESHLHTRDSENLKSHIIIQIGIAGL